MQLARQWFILLSTPHNPSSPTYGNRLGAVQLRGDLDLARSKKKRVRFVSYLRARGDLEAHPSCFGITETSTFQALSRSGRQVNYKFTLPPPTSEYVHALVSHNVFAQDLSVLPPASSRWFYGFMSKCAAVNSEISHGKMHLVLDLRTVHL